MKRKSRRKNKGLQMLNETSKGTNKKDKELKKSQEIKRKINIISVIR